MITVTRNSAMLTAMVAIGLIVSSHQKISSQPEEQLIQGRVVRYAWFMGKLLPMMTSS